MPTPTEPIPVIASTLKTVPPVPTWKFSTTVEMPLTIESVTPIPPFTWRVYLELSLQYQLYC